MEVAIVRRRGVRGGDGRSLAAFVRRLGRCAGSAADEVTVVLVDDDEMTRLNGHFRSRNRTTDVLSFPGEQGPDGVDRQGEIVISLDKARRQACQRHHSLDQELRYLLIHGFLHLMGYDHETDQGEMVARERQLRRELLAGRKMAG